MNEIKSLSERALADNVDRLGHLNAEIKPLVAKAEAIKVKLKEAGVPEIIGHEYRAVVSPREAWRVNADKVRAYLAGLGVVLSDAQFNERLCNSSMSVNVSLYDL